MQSLHVTNSDAEWSPKYYAVIAALFCGMYMITMAIVPKIIVVFGFYFPAGIIIFPICCILTDILTEVYGFNRARQALWVTLFCNLMFAVFTQIAILLPPAEFWPNQDGFASIFATSWRLVIAGSVAWIVGELINSFVVSRMKILQASKNMSVRFIASTMVGQFFDTLIFGLIAFAGTMPLNNLCIMMVSAWIVKVAYEVLALPLSTTATKFIKRAEGIEHFDRQKITVI